MIQVSGLTKRFGNFCALDNLCLHVPKGAVYGLVGPNGAGKSTLIRHLSGVFRPESGEITMDGQKVYENPSIKQRFAYIPDDFFFFPAASLHEMMLFYKGLYPSFDMELYYRLLPIFRLHPHMFLRAFSKGMVKQAAFILSICVRPDVLLLDEPVDGLDPVIRRQVWSLIMQEVAERNMTVLVSSHNLRELEDVCNYVGIMHCGRMLLERSLDELQDNIVKVQAVFGEKRPEGLEILHTSASGRVETMIIRGRQAEVLAQLEALEPVFVDLIPLSLEEIFIYELGGVSYEIKSVLL